MNIALAALTVAAASAIAITAMLLVRRRAPDGGFFNDGDRAAGFFGVLATGFAVLLGFIVFLAFASYDTSRAGAETEALVVVQQVETAQFLPEDATRALTGELACYARYVVEREWPLMEEGGLDDNLNPWGIAMFETFRMVQTASPEQEAAYAKWMDQTSDREQARQDRVHGAEGILPWPLWLALFLMAGLIFVFMLCFADSGERAFIQALLIGTVTAVIASTLLVIMMLERPFSSDPGGLQPTAMERSLDIIEEVAGVGTLGEPPCDDSGAPLA
jgi:hypothetical protein